MDASVDHVIDDDDFKLPDDEPDTKHLESSKNVDNIAAHADGETLSLNKKSRRRVKWLDDEAQRIESERGFMILAVRSRVSSTGVLEIPRGEHYSRQL